MNYRRLGKTELMVSEIGLGGEWLERHDTEECRAVIQRCEENGINILDCWMSEPNVRSNIGRAIAGHREKWIIQGHIGSTWQNGQYVKTRDVDKCRAAFEDLLERMQTDYIDLGMIHYVDKVSDWEELQSNGYLDYVMGLKKKGAIRHIGLSTHNPRIGMLAANSGFVEMMLFSVNPAFDQVAPTEDMEQLFDAANEKTNGIDPERAAFYKLCVEKDIALTVMKGFEGGRLLKEEASPFGIALTPVQLIHYALTRPAVASILVGYDTPEHVDGACAYETAPDEMKDYATALAKAPAHAFEGICTYCGHCKPCPAGIDIAMVNKLTDLALMQKDVPESLREHYRELDKTADDCLMCGGCEKRCPFGVKVRERMKLAQGLFK